MIENLPKNLLLLDGDALEDARRDREERMSRLFRRWPSLTKNQLRELRTLSDERQRLARHVLTLRSLQALRRSPAVGETPFRVGRRSPGSAPSMDVRS